MSRRRRRSVSVTPGAESPAGVVESVDGRAVLAESNWRVVSVTSAGLATALTTTDGTWTATVTGSPASGDRPLGHRSGPERAELANWPVRSG